MGDLDDPIYPHTLPTLAQQLEKIDKPSLLGVRTITIAVSPKAAAYRSYHGDITALSQFLRTQVARSLQSLRLSGSVVPLNHTHLLDALSHLKPERLEIQMDPSAPSDSYSLAAVLASVVGVKKLSLSVPNFREIHRTFREETQDTFSQLVSLNLRDSSSYLTHQTLRGFLEGMFERGSLAHLNKLQLHIHGSARSLELWRDALAKALSPSPMLRSLSLEVLEGNGVSSSSLDFDLVCPLLPTLKNLEQLQVIGSQQAGVWLSNDFFQALPSSLQSIKLGHARIERGANLFSSIRRRLNSLPRLTTVVLSTFVSEPDPPNAWDGSPFPIVWTADAVATTLHILADRFDALGIRYRMVCAFEEGGVACRSSKTVHPLPAPAHRMESCQSVRLVCESVTRVDGLGESTLLAV